jgi:hypothetical protein
MRLCSVRSRSQQGRRETGLANAGNTADEHERWTSVRQACEHSRRGIELIVPSDEAANGQPRRALHVTKYP